MSAGNSIDDSGSFDKWVPIGAMDIGIIICISTFWLGRDPKQGLLESVIDFSLDPERNPFPFYAVFPSGLCSK